MTDTAINAPTTTPDEAPATEPAAPYDALGNVLRAVFDLDEDDTRRVLLAAAEFYGLNLWHNVPTNDPLIRVSTAVKIIDAARAGKP